MKILFVNLPYAGHVIPTVGLVQELIKAGHQVTYLLPRDWEHRIAESGADFLGYESSPKLDRQNLRSMQAAIAQAPGNAGAVSIIENFLNQTSPAAHR